MFHEIETDFRRKKLHVRTESSLSEQKVGEMCGQATPSHQKDSFNSLTMALIGCLPDNVQKAMKSFSIRERKQHINFMFPSMEEVLRQEYINESFSNIGYNGGIKPQQLTTALLFDQFTDVVKGFHTLVTLAPCMNRSSMPIVSLTLYEKGTIEGYQRHFDTLLRTLLDTHILLSSWKMPLFVIEESALNNYDVVIEVCTKTIVGIQSENLHRTYPEKRKEELFRFVQDEIVRPNLVSYDALLHLHINQVANKVSTAINFTNFLALMHLLQSTSCTVDNYQKINLFFKNSSGELVLSEFWRIWGNEQIGRKVFPLFKKRSEMVVTQTSYSNERRSSVMGINFNSGYQTSDGPLTYVPIKEALQSIIKCLKSQDFPFARESEKMIEDDKAKLKFCFCSICRMKTLSRCTKFRSALKRSEFLETESAFRRPESNFKGKPKTTSTIKQSNR